MLEKWMNLQSKLKQEITMNEIGKIFKLILNIFFNNILIELQ